MFAWKVRTRMKWSEVGPCRMKEQKSSRMMPTWLMGLHFSSLLLRGETREAGRGEDGREAESRWWSQVKVVVSQTSAFWEILLNDALVYSWLWYRSVLYSWVLWPPFYWAVLSCMLMLHKSLVHKIVWRAGYVNLSPIVRGMSNWASGQNWQLGIS